MHMEGKVFSIGTAYCWQSVEIKLSVMGSSPAGVHFSFHFLSFLHHGKVGSLCTQPTCPMYVHIHSLPPRALSEVWIIYPLKRVVFAVHMPTATLLTTWPWKFDCERHKDSRDIHTYMNDQSLRQGKAKQLRLKTTLFFPREKEEVGFKPTTFCILGRCSTNTLPTCVHVHTYVGNTPTH